MRVFGTEEIARAGAGDFSSGRARAVFDTLGEGLIVWDTDGRVVDCNRSAADILGRSREALQLIMRRQLSPAPFRPLGAIRSSR